MSQQSVAGVRAERLAYRYGGNGHGLSEISLEARPGEFVLVSGPSGCGKSTLARCLTGLIPHLYRGSLQGHVWLGDLETATAPLWQITGRAGLVFQNPASQMLAGSVEDEIVFGLENLGLPAGEIAGRVEESLARFGLAALRARAPQTLSGGEQQKLALATVMARRPAVLGLDEPLSMLDSTAAADLVSHLADLARSGTAIIIGEHRAEYLEGVPGLRVVALDGNLLRSSGAGASPGPAGPARAVPQFPFHTPPFVLVARDVTVRLGGRAVLDRFGFEARGGEVLAIVGRNGAGKTTLLRALAGLQLHEGCVTAGDMRPDFGLVFQNAELQLFNASVHDEILYRVPDPDLAFYGQLLDALELTPYEHTPPLLLSEGEKKRVVLATVLMRRPRHGVLLDEPSLGQDAAHKAMLIRIARGLARAGQVVILTTHDLALAARADRLLVMAPEGLVADGLPGQVLGDPAPWARVGLTVPSWVRIPPVGDRPEIYG